MTTGTRQQSDTRPRVVIIGSGFGGFFTARHRRLPVCAAAVRCRGRHRRCPVGDGAAVLQLAGCTGRGRPRRSGRSAPAEDPQHRPARKPRRIELRPLIADPDSVTRLLNITGLAEYAIGLKAATEALYLQDLVLQRLETANLRYDPVRRRAMLTFTVVGAG